MLGNEARDAESTPIPLKTFINPSLLRKPPQAISKGGKTLKWGALFLGRFQAAPQNRTLMHETVVQSRSQTLKGAAVGPAILQGKV